ncbi:VIT1/CCC1 transporter family protein [Thermostaphylospora chromogena]|mgnify:CR=1 FL=1|uniref:Predicted Fe2+/Mn2+ transporter, VIT1/CCC1 family n=1 Tax=Thermostaphylospora chromogena TaxID=35622 RepID=A0A1H1DPQ6_9ACTN|nr:VIT family protein [Thermostaphylospora chromogena]SDQ78472.1 Predicted Fe2+/Mn2+ transporter, VIT1/CCC1 family [Thermostaphylospora chromogena]
MSTETVVSIARGGTAEHMGESVALTEHTYPATTAAAPTHRAGRLEHKLNALRAGVLGANDGIVSTAAVVVGVAGATSAGEPILLAGLAAAIGGAVSMALGEYVSVHSQRDSERHLIEEGRRALAADPAAELQALIRAYEERGLSPQTARQVAQELTARNALEAHMRERHNIDPHGVTNPWHAAIASFVSFAIGAVLPLLAILLPAPDLRVPVAFAATLAGLALTGAVAAWIGGGSRLRAAVRVTAGGTLALATTYLIGTLLGTAITA